MYLHNVWIKFVIMFSLKSFAENSHLIGQFNPVANSKCEGFTLLLVESDRCVYVL